MDGMISTDNFIDFYMKLTKEASNLTEYFDIMKDALCNIADDLKLGRCLIIVNSPATGLEINEIQDRCEVYLSDGGYNVDAGVRQTYVTNDWGIVQIELYPKIGCKWIDDNSRELEFIIQVLYDCISKTRASIIMRQSTITDSLTGACNSTGIVNYLTELKKNGKIGNYTTLFLNIKNFHYINSRVGGRQGDKVIKEFSRMIRDYLVKGELFGRVGGDTFFIAIGKERVDDALKFITSRRVLVELDSKSVEFDLMVRVGVYDAMESDSTERVIEATRAAYDYTRNPSSGDVIFFKEEMLAASSRDEEISNQFINALNRKEFAVYYQPKVDLKTSNLISAEALCRWIKDDKVVAPMDFIPVLERDGSIGKLDFYMLNQVCEHISEWKDKGIEPVRVAVNFSRANILNKKLAEKIIKVINSHKVDTKYIEVEITEMSGYENFEALSEFVDYMKKNDIEVSLDDFGTGYSSLNLIKDLNVNTIKLDRSFLSQISDDNYNMSQNMSVVKNIISMVNELDMKVVAEGVETDAQRRFLTQVNCQVAQGYLFDKPMPKEAFELKLLGERKY